MVRSRNFATLLAERQAKISASIADSKKRGLGFKKNAKAEALFALAKANTWVYAEKRYSDGYLSRSLTYMFMVEDGLRVVSVAEDSNSGFREIERRYFDDLADLEYYIACRMTTPDAIGVDDRSKAIWPGI